MRDGKDFDFYMSLYHLLMEMSGEMAIDNTYHFIVIIVVVDVIRSLHSYVEPVSVHCNNYVYMSDCNC